MYKSLAKTNLGFISLRNELKKINYVNKMNLSKRHFSEKKDEEPLEEDTEPIEKKTFTRINLQTMTPKNLKSYIEKIDTSINEHIFAVKSLPDPNFFGEALLYYSPPGLMSRTALNYEYSGVSFMTLMTFLSFNKILFEHSYFFPYFAFLTSISYLRAYATIAFGMPIVYQITLINEHQVRIVYLSGESEVVEIKNISLSRYPPEDFRGTGLTIQIKLGPKKTAIIVLKNNFPFDKFNAYAELELLLGILNKKTKKLSVI